MKICVLFSKMSDKELADINPPEDMVVNAKLNESRSLKSVKLYKKITKMVVDE